MGHTKLIRSSRTGPPAVEVGPFLGGGNKQTGSHWAFSIAATVVAISLLVLGVNRTNIAISVVSLLMLFVLQNTQNRDSAALHLKLDEVITHLHGPRDKVAGIESKTEDEIEELKQAAPVE